MADTPAIIIPSRSRDLGGGLMVGRVLPYARRRMVGPFIFLDQIGPTSIPAGAQADIRPHPHIGLATVTYLFAGEFLHRDSLGSVQPIRPGAVNWMTAGRGIVHSERMPDDVKQHGGPLHGVQTWVALPREEEERAPSFAHHPHDALPEFNVGRATLRLITGEAFGHVSPVEVFSPTTYAHVRLPAGESLTWETGRQELALQPVSGALRVNDVDADPSALVVFDAHRSLRIEAKADADFLVLGGEPLEGPRFIWWNFVSSSNDRLAEAREAWRLQRFPKIPDDQSEFIPLPSDPPPPAPPL